MKIALMASGQPRFTQDFIFFMNKLKGFDHADLYFNLWESDWSRSEEEAKQKIQPILLPKYNIKKIKIVPEPEYILPPHKLYHPPPAPENIRWCYKRQIAQWQGIKMVYSLIDQEYDAIIRFRVDGCLVEDYDISKLDLKKNNLYFTQYGGGGWDGQKINDQFWIGTYEGNKFIIDFVNNHDKLIPISDPNWEYNRHGTWTSEYLLGTYMNLNNKKTCYADFKFHINFLGYKSKYTDKHYHLPVVKDPTEI